MFDIHFTNVDQESEFTCYHLQQMCISHKHAIYYQEFKTNAICKLMQQTISNLLHISEIFKCYCRIQMYTIQIMSTDK